MRTALLWIFAMVVGADAVQLPRRRFVPNNANPASDLHAISQSQASIVTRVWLQKIIQEDPTIAPEDECAVKQINRLEAHVQNEANQGDLYMVWTPEPYLDEHGLRDVLFVLASSVDIENKRMSVKLLVQSPLWCPDQIRSGALKDSLESMATTIGATIDFDDLYKAEPRYKLEWENWYK